MLLQTSIFAKFIKTRKMSYFKYNVNPSKRVKMARFFLGLAGLLLRISLGLCPWKFPRSSPASPQKNPVHHSCCTWINLVSASDRAAMATWMSGANLDSSSDSSMAASSSTHTATSYFWPPLWPGTSN